MRRAAVIELRTTVATRERGAFAAGETRNFLALAGAEGA
jgi:hypothetical protein